MVSEEEDSVGELYQRKAISNRHLAQDKILLADHFPWLFRSWQPSLPFEFLQKFNDIHRGGECGPYKHPEIPKISADSERPRPHYH